MEAENLSWDGYEVRTAEATWVCTTSQARPISSTPDGIDYFLEFSAQDKRSSDIPDVRRLLLRTSAYLVSTDVSYLKLVVDGQMLETSPWDRFKEVFEKD
jgi:hypothetical protein